LERRRRIHIEYWYESQQGKTPLGKLRRMWLDNIKMKLGEAGCGGMAWIDLEGSCERGNEQFRKLLGSS
jgi:hypothetical protein